MEERLTIIRLYDYYGELLTEKQKQYFEDYYFNNLSLGEISDNYGVSRNAVHKSLKELISKLELYEEKLKLVEKRNKIEKILKNSDSKIQDEILELL